MKTSRYKECSQSHSLAEHSPVVGLSVNYFHLFVLIFVFLSKDREKEEKQNVKVDW